MMRQIVTVIGKGAQKIARLKGGGSALPGLIVERIDPSFLRTSLAQLPKGVVLVSGTNGKTTTTKMVVELLEGQGLTVFTNRTGSNFTRGIIAAVIEATDKTGALPYDIAVLELDEAYAVKFVQQIKPGYTLLLNVFRDQLDRFGELDATAAMLQKVAAATTDCVVLNRDDPRLVSPDFTKNITAPIRTYGLSTKVAAMFPTDTDHDQKTLGSTAITKPNDTQLEDFTDKTATISYDNQNYQTSLKLKGIYNIQNATAAVALVRAVMGKSLNSNHLVNSLARVEPAFGRGEDIMINGQPVELVLVKNPSGFRLSLASFSPDSTATMVAINDNYADGRDMSWLWDVDFSSLAPDGVVSVTGIRAYDMALRLQYDEVEVSHVSPDIAETLKQFLANHAGVKKRIYCTYTAMLTIRKHLSKIASVEKIL